MEQSEIRKLVKTFARRNESHAKLQFISGDEEGFLIRLVEEQGLMNHVYRVTSQDGSQSVIIKYGEEKAQGWDVLYDMKRQGLEYNALELFDSIYPGSVPQPYCFDKDLHIIAMEDLSNMTILRSSILEVNVSIKHAQMLGEILAEIHKHTHKNVVTEETWKDFTSKFRLVEHMNTYKMLRFVNIFQEDHPDNEIVDDCLELYRTCIEALERGKIPGKLLDTFNREECLIHSDLHQLSVFVSDDRAAVFDLEFACLGNPAYDVSFMIINFICSHYESVTKYPDRKERGKRLTKTITQAILRTYLEGRDDMKSLESKRAFMSELILFMGATLFGKVITRNLSNCFAADQKKVVLKSSLDLMMSHEEPQDWHLIIDNLLWT